MNAMTKAKFMIIDDRGLSSMKNVEEALNKS